MRFQEECLFIGLRYNLDRILLKSPYSSLMESEKVKNRVIPEKAGIHNPHQIGRTYLIPPSGVLGL